jgi:hypothetical protein
MWIPTRSVGWIIKKVGYPILTMKTKVVEEVVAEVMDMVVTAVPVVVPVEDTRVDSMIINNNTMCTPVLKLITRRRNKL